MSIHALPLKGRALFPGLEVTRCGQVYQLEDNRPYSIILPHPQGLSLSPATAGQPQLQQLSPLRWKVATERRNPNLSKVMKAVTASSNADSLSLSSPPGNQSPKEFDKFEESCLPKESN
ncbi:hypothetical protein NQ317_004478 [Molorchus minor]|uniref:Uncharacterized protein n=1 Tax=Molorchus minor TaxID=1323400 RepID=A0ABQ9IR73_9CUCU|nr:hypothetical protein NQ317_004478 [Molorchus minor]